MDLKNTVHNPYMNQNKVGIKAPRLLPHRLCLFIFSTGFHTLLSALPLLAVESVVMMHVGQLI